MNTAEHLDHEEPEVYELSHFDDFEDDYPSPRRLHTLDAPGIGEFFKIIAIAVSMGFLMALVIWATTKVHS